MSHGETYSGGLELHIMQGGCAETFPQALYIGSLVENRPLLSGKVRKLYPRGDFVVSQREKIKIDQSARESALSKIKQEPTSGWSWLLSSRNRSVLGS